jgi:UDP-N-acetylmuramate dehydrogenase
VSTASPSLAQELLALPDLAVESGVDLAPLTTFRIGGPADLLVEVPTLRGLRSLLAVVRDSGSRLWLLGLGSNVLIPDQGLPGLVIRLTGYFGRVRVRGSRVSAGAAVPLARLARRMAARGLVGLEPLSGFPSTVGGAVYMNAGCYGTEIKDLLIRATLVDRRGELRRIGVDELGASYRRTRLQESGEIVTLASFQLAAGDAGEALARIRELNRRRWASLPSGAPNAGSIFRNPPGDFAGRLIESVGLKGRRRGGAEISPRHANVIVNVDRASAADVLGLMAEARAAVREAHGVTLEPEIELAGDLQARWAEITERAGTR